MNELWAAIALLMCVASGFVVWAAKRPLPASGAEPDRKNALVALFRSKQVELDQELAAASISRSDYDQRLAEMQRTLLVETQTEAAGKTKEQGAKGGLLMLFIAIILPIAGFLTYVELGAYKSLEQRENMQLTRNIAQQAQTVEGLVNGLSKALEQQPNNPEGWYLLANSLMQSQQLTQGVAAFEQAISYAQIGSTQHAALLGQYAQALFFNDGAFTPRVNEAIAAAMAMDEQDVSALSLLGIQAFEAQSYNAAIGFWQRALPRAGSGQGKASLQSGIASAQQLLTGVSGQDIGDASVAVHINLAHGLSVPDAQQAVLFVYIKQSGRPMPLFATKLDPRHLPLDVIMTDAMALQAGTHLADFKNVEIAAHIALAGVPGQMPGDLVSQTKTVVVDGVSRLELTIDQILK